MEPLSVDEALALAREKHPLDLSARLAFMANERDAAPNGSISLRWAEAIRLVRNGWPRDEGLSISFSGDASEGFADRIEQMKGWYVRLTPREGEPFDAYIVGSGQDVEVDGGTWVDSVTFRRIEGEIPTVIRVRDVYVY